MSSLATDVLYTGIGIVASVLILLIAIAVKVLIVGLVAAAVVFGAYFAADFLGLLALVGL